MYNKGLCGSCLCEPQTAEYLCSCEDWDFATLELGVNMRGSFDAETFKKRVDFMADSFLSAAEGRPIVLITIFPNSDDVLKEANRNTEINRKFREVLRGVHEQRSSDNLHIIEGSEVLSDFSVLSQDLVHPSGEGHQLMGMNLAAKLRELGILDRM